MSRKKRHHKRKSPVKWWEWFLSIGVTGISGVIVWTNESVDLLSKFGIFISPGLTFIIFGIAFMLGLSWISTNWLRHKRLL